MRKTNLYKSAELVSRYEQVFTCPICNSPLQVEKFKSMVCPNRHTFDFAKQGYLNLLKHPLKTKYEKMLFEARRKVIREIGFFKPLDTKIVELIKKWKGPLNEPHILDAGCGEGSHLAIICEQLVANGGSMGVGIDIAKEGIVNAAKFYPQQIWIVGDLASLPFSDHQFDCVVNILSPSNYGEFKRVLNNEGIMIKVVPQSEYLRELREEFINKPGKLSYSNEEVVSRLDERFQIVNRSKVRYTQVLENEALEALVRMTPLTWSAAEEQIQAFLDKGSSKITVDLEVLVGKVYN